MRFQSLVGLGAGVLALCQTVASCKCNPALLKGAYDADVLFWSVLAIAPLSSPGQPEIVAVAAFPEENAFHRAYFV